MAEQREHERADRILGLARDQALVVHEGVEYDLEIDSSAATPEVCAQRIRSALQTNS